MSEPGCVVVDDVPIGGARWAGASRHGFTLLSFGMATTEAPVTWIHEGPVSDVKVNGQVFRRHLVRLNNRGVGYLFNTVSTTPVRRIEGVKLTIGSGTTKLSGTNVDDGTETGTAETWTHNTRVSGTRQCGSCGK